MRFTSFMVSLVSGRRLQKTEISAALRLVVPCCSEKYFTFYGSETFIDILFTGTSDVNLSDSASQLSIRSISKLAESSLV